MPDVNSIPTDPKVARLRNLLHLHAGLQWLAAEAERRRSPQLPDATRDAAIVRERTASHPQANIIAEALDADPTPAPLLYRWLLFPPSGTQVPEKLSRIIGELGWGVSDALGVAKRMPVSHTVEVRENHIFANHEHFAAPPLCVALESGLALWWRDGGRWKGAGATEEQRGQFGGWIDNAMARAREMLGEWVEAVAAAGGREYRDAGWDEGATGDIEIPQAIFAEVSHLNAGQVSKLAKDGVPMTFQEAMNRRQDRRKGARKDDGEGGNGGGTGGLVTIEGEWLCAGCNKVSKARFQPERCPECKEPGKMKPNKVLRPRP